MTDHSSVYCASGQACQLEAEFVALKQEVKQLSELVSSDPLTNLFNFRHFNTALNQEIERSQRTLQATTLIMLDVDHFKSVNDQWGHEVGNIALKSIATSIISNIRKLDIACRYGGEEFAIILPSTDIMTGAQVAERIRHAVENTPIIFHTENETSHEEQSLQLTISLGLSTYSGNRQQTVNNLTEAADQQLYKAKHNGRNQVCFEYSDNAEQQVSEDEKSALFDMFKKE